MCNCNLIQIRNVKFRGQRGGPVGQDDHCRTWLLETYVAERGVRSYNLSSDLHMYPTPINNTTVQRRRNHLLAWLVSLCVLSPRSLLVWLCCWWWGYQIHQVRRLLKAESQVQEGQVGENVVQDAWLPGSSTNYMPVLRASLAGSGWVSET